MLSDFAKLVHYVGPTDVIMLAPPPHPTPTICSSDRQQLSMSYVLLLQVSKFTNIKELPIHTQRSINLAQERGNSPPKGTIKSAT